MGGGSDANELWLMFNEKPLHDGQLLVDYALSPNSTLVAHLRLRGGVDPRQLGEDLQKLAERGRRFRGDALPRGSTVEPDAPTRHGRTPPTSSASRCHRHMAHLWHSTQPV
jgi:hypothetical protein